MILPSVRPNDTGDRDSAYPIDVGDMASLYENATQGDLFRRSRHYPLTKA